MLKDPSPLPGERGRVRGAGAVDLPEGFAGGKPIASEYSGGSCATGRFHRPSFVGSIPSVHTSSIFAVRSMGSWWNLMEGTMLLRSEPMSDGRHFSGSAAIGCSGSGITTC